MKKVVILAVLAAAIAWGGPTAAFADLGDTYAQSCRKYGGRGEVDRKHHAILWHCSRHWVEQCFVKNHCVEMRLIPDRDSGYVYGPDDMINVLPSESSLPWVRISGPNGGYVGCWRTTDDSVLAAVYTDGTAQVAYKWFAARKGRVENVPSDDYGKAPVEDDGAPGDSM